MSNSILELIRSKHEDIEHLEKALAKAISFKENNPREQIVAESLIKKFLEDIQKRSKELLDIYYDKDGLKKEEVDVLAGNKNYLHSNLSIGSNISTRIPDVWYNFYEKLKEAKNINKQINNEINENMNSEKLFSSTLEEIMIKPVFTAEENKGRCVDMHEIYMNYVNFKKLKELKTLEITDYLSYLSEFDKFHVIPIYIKKMSKYKEYIKEILEYIKKFFIRSHPLIDYNKIYDCIDEDFEKEWPNIPGWEKIKSENIIYCQFCQKSFTNNQVYEYHKKGKTHLKNINKNSHIIDQNEVILNEEEEDLREIGYFEFQILRFKELLSDVFENTKNLIRKKQSMNLDEIEADVIDEKELDQIEFDDEEEKKIYNPKNVPLGWDGKPIPYWLYKLHGLGTEYKCEICGNASYWGLKAFERHFQEWRHSYGMKCLKIPNTIHFKGVTGIEDALKLHQSLLESKKKEIFKPEVEEEYEDSEGNVVTKKMYMDLIRQGLI